MFANSSYYHKLKDFHQKFGKKHIQIKIFKISGSSLFILEVLQGHIFCHQRLMKQIRNINRV